MNRNFSITREPIFDNPEKSKIWLKYCGFLDLSIEDFMFIQKQLLGEQMELVGNSGLGSQIMRGQKPESVEQFRNLVPLTTYQDYEPWFREKKDDLLPGKPAVWARTSGRSGTFKWVPYNKPTLARLADDTLSAFILSSARKKGDVRLYEGAKVMLNLPPLPYMSGLMAAVAQQRLPYRAMPALEEADQLQFEERIRRGFVLALEQGMDYAASIAVVLAKTGENFGKLSKEGFPSWNPAAVYRLLKAKVKSGTLRRGLLPSDLWQVRGLVCGGTDTAIYRDQIKRYWGVDPLDAYGSTETGFIAMQAWNKKDMTFIPYSNFYEFIAEQEWLKSLEDKSYKPHTVLLDEVEESKIYEIVLTNFRGGPFLRYRLGDLIKIESLYDKEIGVNLPQMSYHSRCDNVIDISGFARLDEKTIRKAIENTRVPYVDWAARKETAQGKPVLHIYVEPSQNDVNQVEFEKVLDRELTALDGNYAELETIIGLKPLAVTLLAKGTFQKYAQRKKESGFDLPHLKPPHMNANDATIKDLIFPE